MGTRRLAVLGTAAALLAGCAHAGPSTAGPSGGGEPVAPSPFAPPSSLPPGSLKPPLSFSPPVPGKSGQARPEQTISGQVEAGVEHGCLILRASTGTYQLLGGDPTIVYVGADVLLTGHVVTGVMSHCMQGEPFQITQARRR